jgi:2-polyprenyl-3-methyl-5-hydroxy-6-metoxy-1,4-benzoquinol methylase
VGRDVNRRASTRPFSYSRCTRCRSLFIDAIPEDLGGYYPADYHGIPTPDAFERHLPEERYRLELLVPHVQGGKLVEVGPGCGFFAALAKRAGFDVMALEHDPACCRFLADHVGVDAVRTARPERATIEAGSRDAVALWHSLEHLPDPVAMLEAATRWLRLGGVLLVAVPNPESFQLRALGSLWPHLDAPRHVAFLTLSELDRRMTELGADRIAATTTDPGGRHWNAFGWEHGLAHVASAIGVGGHGQKVARRAGRLLAKVLAPVEGRGMRGATYTAVFRRRAST